MATRASFQGLAGNLINSTFADFRDPIILNQMGEADYDTQIAPILNTVNAMGIRLEFDKSQFNNSSIEVGDYKIILEQQPVDFDVRADNVKMIFNGKNVSIIDVTEDAARAVLTIQARDL